MTAAKPTLSAILRAHLAADRRKTAVLVVLAIAMLVIYGRLFFNRTGPQAAAASPVESAFATTQPAGTASAAAAPTRWRPDRPLKRDLGRDPFAARLELYASDPDSAASGRTDTAGSEKNGARRPPEPPLVLQSTLCGRQPLAWINGRCLRPGDVINGHVVEEIEPARVSLRRGPERRVLRLE